LLLYYIKSKYKI